MNYLLLNSKNSANLIIDPSEQNVFSENITLNDSNTYMGQPGSMLCSIGNLKYGTNEIKTLTNSPITQPDDLKSVSLPTYLSWVIHKIFANQDASRDKYSKYLCQLEAKDYPEINREKFDLDMLTREIIINRAYEEYKKYYHTQLLNKNF